MTAILRDSAARGRFDPAAPDPFAAVERALSPGACILAARLVDYYAPDGDECATSFLDGTETEAPRTVTAGDLFAVGTLGIPVRLPASRRLLHDTPHSARVADCLAPSRLPLDATLADADAAVIRAMTDLHEAIVSAVDPGRQPAEDSHVFASALCARKRPELFPVLDRNFRAALALPAAAAPLPSWLVLRSLLRRRHVDEALADAFRLARANGHIPIDVYPLRQLYVLACHVRAESAGITRSS